MNLESFDAGKEKQGDGLDELRRKNVSVTVDDPGVEDFMPTEEGGDQIVNPEEEAWRELDKKHNQ